MAQEMKQVSSGQLNLILYHVHVHEGTSKKFRPGTNKGHRSRWTINAVPIVNTKMHRGQRCRVKCLLLHGVQVQISRATIEGCDVLL